MASVRFGGGVARSGKTTGRPASHPTPVASRQMARERGYPEASQLRRPSFSHRRSVAIT
jgi:hypothetical protein